MKNNSNLSVVLATFNEEENLRDCLLSVKDIANEIVIVDGTSQDKTVEIAKEFNSKVLVTDNHPIFHINKQKALDMAKNEWILALDADERVSHKLAQEITRVINLDNEEIEKYQESLKNRKLFLKHQKLLEQRDGKIGDEKLDYCAFFIPRLNYFLGKYLRYGGVYPDGVIRLVRKGQAYFPCKDVHEQIVVKGKVGWLENDLLHLSDPTFKRYLMRNSRYINLIAEQLKEGKVAKNLIQSISYMVIKPIWWFLLTTIRHKGILDGLPGIIFSFFSALRFPRAYLRYLLR